MWESFTGLQRVFFVIALPATILLVVQSIMIFIGLDNDGDAFDAGDDPDGDGIVTFIIRGLIAFFTLGGWSGFAMASTPLNSVVVVLLSFIIGAIGFLGIIYLIRGILKMQDSGNLDLKNCVDKIGKVYIPIPPTKSGAGKVTMTVQGRFIEVDAITTETTKIGTDETVKVVDQLDDNTVIVQRV